MKHFSVKWLFLIWEKNIYLAPADYYMVVKGHNDINTYFKHYHLLTERVIVNIFQF